MKVKSSCCESEALDDDCRLHRVERLNGHRIVCTIGEGGRGLFVLSGEVGGAYCAVKWGWEGLVCAIRDGRGLFVQSQEDVGGACWRRGLFLLQTLLL